MKRFNQTTPEPLQVSAKQSEMLTCVILGGGGADSELVSFENCSNPQTAGPVSHWGVTLAEVLITLGIIGVVSAITVPTIISKIQDRQNIAKWKKEYSVISNAFQQTLNEGIDVCGAYSYWGGCATPDGNQYFGPLTEEFRNKMLEQMSVVDYCMVTGQKACDNYTDWNPKSIKYKWSGIANIYSRYKALGSKTKIKNHRAEYGVHAYNFNSYAYLLKDGAVVYFGDSHGGPWIVVDVNNFNKGPNEFGRDVFVINVYSNNKTNKHWAKAMGAEGTFNKNINGETCECSKDKGVKSANYIAGGNGEGEVISGACCSAYYLYSK